MATDCPEPEKCRRCRKEGHKVDECPEPEKCFNCREEGHKVSKIFVTFTVSIPISAFIENFLQNSC